MASVSDILGQMNSALHPAAPPQMTPGSNGYVGLLPQTNYGANPWHVDNVQPELTQGAQNLQGQATQMQNYTAQSAPYPSFPNTAGLGSQTAFQTPPSNPAPPDSGSRGFNPWSLQGEALSR